jgi:3-methyladenine DNA glycosylase/8-oxoguanine DNA glycosylase
VRPPWPHRLPRRSTADGVTRVRNGILARLLYVDAAPVIVHAWSLRDGTVRLRATPRDKGIDREALEVAIERIRFAVGVDEDYRELYDCFRGDRLLGPAIRRRAWVRPRRHAWPWEALAWAVTKQLIPGADRAPREPRAPRRAIRGRP